MSFERRVGPLDSRYRFYPWGNSDDRAIRVVFINPRNGSSVVLCNPGHHLDNCSNYFLVEAASPERFRPAKSI